MMKEVNMRMSVQERANIIVGILGDAGFLKPYLTLAQSENRRTIIETQLICSHEYNDIRATDFIE